MANLNAQIPIVVVHKGPRKNSKIYIDIFTTMRVDDEEGNKLTYKDSLGYFEIKGEKVTEKEFNEFINK